MPRRREGGGCPMQPAGAAEGRRRQPPPTHTPGFLQLLGGGRAAAPHTLRLAPHLPPHPPSSAWTDTQTHAPGALRSPTCSPASCWKHLGIGRLPSGGSSGSSLTARASPADAPRPASARGHGAAPRSARLRSAGLGQAALRRRPGLPPASLLEYTRNPVKRCWRKGEVSGKGRKT